MSTISIREHLAGRKILLTGASGFVGKVWLAMILDRVPDAGRIYVLVRGKGRTAMQRFTRMLNTSPAFKPLHDAHGAALGEFLRERLEVLEGDVAEDNLGLDEVTAQRIRNEVDLVINCAGLVDFNPDLRAALSANMDGARKVGEFVMASKKARVLHISTCYVAGHQEGFVPESADYSRAPSGEPFDIEAEVKNAQDIVQREIDRHESTQIQDQIREEVVARIRKNGYEEKESRIRTMATRLHRRKLKEALIEAGTERSVELGWPNTYTYTKAMAEAWLLDHVDADRCAVLRPAIVESAVSFPFPGWNEGFNTSGPLVYLAGTWLRHIPAKPDNNLDVIPVDYVCNAMTLAAVQLLRGEHASIYQVGSSHLNPLSMERIFELSALAHRRHLRKTGSTRLRRMLLSRWDIRATEPEDVLNVPYIRRGVAQVARFLRHGLPEKIPHEVREKADELAKTTETQQRRLQQIEDVMELFQPFIHDHDFTFECMALQDMEVEEPEFAFDPRSIDWRRYWLDVHMPGLRRWCFPEYEGKERESYRAPHAVKLEDAEGEAREEAG